MSTRHCATLIANRQGVAPALAAALQHRAPIFGTHTRQKAVFAAARNTFRLPGSLWHRKQLLCWRYHPILISLLSGGIAGFPVVAQRPM
jgi:hypothetical protein